MFEAPGYVSPDGFRAGCYPAPLELWPSRSLQLCARHSPHAPSRAEALAILDARGITA